MLAGLCWSLFSVSQSHDADSGSLKIYSRNWNQLPRQAPPASNRVESVGVQQEQEAAWNDARSPVPPTAHVPATPLSLPPAGPV